MIADFVSVIGTLFRSKKVVAAGSLCLVPVVRKLEQGLAM
jgi:hypothetical protein